NNPEFFKTFLRTIKKDYEKHGPQLQAAIEKLLKNIMLQKLFYSIESVKRRKTKAGMKKSDNKKNYDPHIIPARKVQTVDKKKHSL
ncbi:3874_t:CDS:2, partial [Gigaspora margarita]